jgi:hypothetical protein
MTIDELVVKIRADESALRSGFRSADRELSAFARRTEAVSNQLNSAIGGALSAYAITSTLGRAFRAADELATSYRQLSAAASLSGIELTVLSQAAQETKSRMETSTLAANGLAAELGKLASRAGEIDQLSEGMQAFLQLGGAQGLGAAETLTAVRQAVLGIDEGTDKLFGKNPSALYAEYAASIGVSAGKLTEAQKAQAILSAAIRDGGRVAEQYADYLKSPQGQLDQLRIKTDEAFGTLGRALEVTRTAAIPVLADLAVDFARFVGGIQLMGAELPVFAARARLAIAELDDAAGGIIESSSSPGWAVLARLLRVPLHPHRCVGNQGYRRRRAGGTGAGAGCV